MTTDIKTERTMTFNGVTYRRTHLGTRRHDCTIQRAQDISDGEVYYLVIQNGKLMGRAHSGEGAVAMAKPFNLFNDPQDADTAGLEAMLNAMDDQ